MKCFKSNFTSSAVITTLSNSPTLFVKVGDVTVLLQTARTVVLEDDDKREEVSIIFNSGSQHLYITSKLQKRLKLKDKVMSILTFRSTKEGNQVCDLV